MPEIFERLYRALFPKAALVRALRREVERLQNEVARLRKQAEYLGMDALYPSCSPVDELGEQLAPPPESPPRVKLLPTDPGFVVDVSACTPELSRLAYAVALEENGPPPRPNTSEWRDRAAASYFRELSRRIEYIPPAELSREAP